MKVKLKKRVKKRRPKRGDIVSWCQNCGNGKYEGYWGMVDEVFRDAVVVDHLENREMRTIKPLWGDRAIPLEEFEDNKYHKLPKGWSYDTELYKLDFRSYAKEDEKKLKESKITDPKAVKELYEAGLLVKSKTKFHGSVEAEITKDGYRIVKKYPMWEHHIDYRSVRPDLIRFSYWIAQSDCITERGEFERQASLSDYEWSMEQIQKSINLYMVANGFDEKAPQVQDAIYFFRKMNRKDVEKVETRVSLGHLQWKYEDKRKWITIV